MILALFLLLAVIVSAVSSCSVMFQGAMSNVVSTSYTSENEELIAANDDYTALETALQQQIDNIEWDYPDYDEYRYDLDPINHDPHQLASYLTALLQYFKASEVQDELQRVFEQQYKLTITETVEVRYRIETRTDTWTDEDGNTQDFVDGERQGNQNTVDIALSQVGNVGGFHKCTFTDAAARCIPTSTLGQTKTVHIKRFTIMCASKPGQPEEKAVTTKQCSKKPA